MLFVDMTLEDTRMIAKFNVAKDKWHVILICHLTGKEEGAYLTSLQLQATVNIALNKDGNGSEVDWVYAEHGAKAFKTLRIIP